MIDSRLLEDACIRRVVVLSGVRPAGRTTEQREGRQFHGLLYLREGAVSFAWQGKTLAAGVGTLIYIPKGLRYKSQYREDGTSFVLVNFDLFDKERGDLFLADEPTIVASEEAGERIDRTMTSLEWCGASQGAVASLRRKEMVFRLLGAICSTELFADANEKSLGAIRAGVNLLEQTYLENLPIARFAEASNMSLSSFRSLFKKHYGASPVQYRNRLRLERARELLREGGYTVSEAAYAVGFENLGYFCRYYKRVMGETPSESKTLW